MNETHRAFGIGAPAPIIEEIPQVRDVLLGSDNSPNATIPRAHLFGQLIELAMTEVRHYHSDFYHDAMWIHVYVTGQTDLEFYYGFDDCGTHIGTDKGLIPHRKQGYHVHAFRKGAWEWVAIFTQIRRNGIDL